MSIERLIDLAKGSHLHYNLSVLKTINPNKLPDCSTCHAATSKRLPKSGESPRGTADGRIVHIDLTDRVNSSIEGFEYGLVLFADQ